jgi:hypothetical protein
MSVWNYAVTAQKPTCVTHSCVGNFTSPQELNLIVAYVTSLYPFFFLSFVVYLLCVDVNLGFRVLRKASFITDWFIIVLLSLHLL